MKGRLQSSVVVQDRGKALARRGSDAPGFEPVTGRMAAEIYLKWLTAKNPRTAADTREAAGFYRGWSACLLIRGAWVRVPARSPPKNKALPTVIKLGEPSSSDKR